jgi:hypothetical protein
MAADIEVGIRLTMPYGKSAPEGQMRHAIAAMQESALHNACTNFAPRRLNQR